MDYKNEMLRGEKCPEEICEKDGCYKECNFYTGVSLPVEIEPKATVGEVETVCCGDPIVKKDCDDCSCHRVTITQNFFIKIPICYQVKTSVGKCESSCKDKKD